VQRRCNGIGGVVQTSQDGRNRLNQDETVVEGPFTNKPTQSRHIRALFEKALATLGELSGGWF